MEIGKKLREKICLRLKARSKNVEPVDDRPMSLSTMKIFSSSSHGSADATIVEENTKKYG